MFQIIVSVEDGSRREPRKYATEEEAQAECRRRKLEADLRTRAWGGE